MPNYHQRRLAILRRRRREARKAARAADPLSVPPSPGTRCAVCAARPAEAKGEIGVAGIAGSLIFPACKPCRDAAPGIIERTGFRRFREMILRNMKPC